MKNETILFVFTCLIWLCNSSKSRFSVIETRADLKTQKYAAEKVLSRILKPYRARMFELKIINSTIFPIDGFQISKSDNDYYVYVTAPSGVSALWGVHYYLKNYCDCHISWDGDQISFPDELPSVNITFLSQEKYRYYQNPCASSYSYAWWDWKRWEREIDWMAMNGVNLALAFNAQEAIWERVYAKLNISSDDFTGPGFLAWYRMGNIRSFSNGFPEDWHKYKIYMQHKILKRMRELGITPVLPGFCGIIPTSLLEKNPALIVQKLPKWNNFPDEYCCPLFLQPTDPFFNVIAQMFYKEYSKEFGTNHIYSCDIFNENTPASSNQHYLRSVSLGIFLSMQLADPLAIWMLQGWMFNDRFWESVDTAKAFLEGVPVGKLLILDLQSDLTPQYERLNSYFGHSFIWCTLHNFGGQLGIYGHLSKINEGIIRGRTFKKSSMVGIGITPEGIDQNYIIYEFTLDGALRTVPANLTEWVSNYAVRRYAIYNEDLDDAWLILKNTAYNYNPSTLYRETVAGTIKTTLLNGEHISKNILTELPSLEMTEFSWYNKSKMFDVYQKFLDASKDYDVAFSSLFRHDLIDVTRQTIQFAVSTLYFKLIKSFTLMDNENFQNTASLFLKLFDELDVILRTGKKFLLGPWVDEATDWGTGQEEVNHMSFDARNQITLWGPNGELRDYAAKQWSGLISDFYKPRWEIFIEALNDSLAGRAPYNAEDVKERIFVDVEKPFVELVDTYPVKSKGDPIRVISHFNKKWGNVLYEIFKGRKNDNMPEWNNDNQQNYSFDAATEL